MATEPDDKEKLRPGHVSLLAKDFRDNGTWDVLVSDVTIRESRDRGMELASELGVIVPWILEHPTAIFRGIRWELDEDKRSETLGWLCYVGLPEVSFDNQGKECEPWEDQVYLVFVNEDRVVYHFRWEKCCPDNPRLPIGHNDRERPRFKKRVL